MCQYSYVHYTAANAFAGTFSVPKCEPGHLPRQIGLAGTHFIMPLFLWGRGGICASIYIYILLQQITVPFAVPKSGHLLRKISLAGTYFITAKCTDANTMGGGIRTSISHEHFFDTANYRAGTFIAPKLRPGHLLQQISTHFIVQVFSVHFAAAETFAAPKRG